MKNLNRDKIQHIYDESIDKHAESMGNLLKNIGIEE